MTIRLVLAGEPSMVRDGVRYLLAAESDFELVGEAADQGEAIHVLHRLRPDVLLVDEDTLAGDPGCDGLTDRLDLAETARRGGIRIVVMADRMDPPAFLRAVDIGASGYLLKGDGTGSLLAAIRAAADGDAWFSPPAARHLVDRYRGRPSQGPPANPRSERGHLLSTRELTVVALLARGRSNAEIAQELSLARSTVKTHVSRILAKLELRDRVQLAAFAHQNDLA